MNKKICLVKNRSASRVVYKIPEDGIRREFSPGEVKKISYEELEKLSYQPGGVAVMACFLQLQSEEAMGDLGIRAEPEYFMNEKQIIDLITSGSLDAFLDCLDFAPTGVVDLLKKYSISLPLSDYEKKKALKEKTGLDIDTILTNIEAEKTEEPAKTSTGQEAVAPSNGRRVASNYKVVHIGASETESK